MDDTVINNNKRGSGRPILFCAHTKTEMEPLGAETTILQTLLLLRPIKSTSRGLQLSCSLGRKASCKICKWSDYIFFSPNYQGHSFQTEWRSFNTRHAPCCWLSISVVGAEWAGQEKLEERGISLLSLAPQCLLHMTLQSRTNIPRSAKATSL